MEAGLKLTAIKKSPLKRVNVDTTVQEIEAGGKSAEPLCPCPSDEKGEGDHNSGAKR